MKFVDLVKNFFSEGDARSLKAKRHVVASFGLKGMSIVLGLVLVPIVLNYLDAERYGIWLTLSSIIAWFSFFDVGLGNGLRNKLSEAFADGDLLRARMYVSTTYFILTLLVVVVLALFFIINPFLDWQVILNTTTVETKELALIAAVVFVFFMVRMVLGLIGSILLADQRPAVSNAFGPIGNLFSFIAIVILSKVTEGSLVTLAFVLSMTPVVVIIGATVFLFSKDYRNISPSLKYVDLSKYADLLNLGFKFLYLQMSSIVFFSTTNFLIAQYSDQTNVAAYNIAYKYLFVTNMVYSIILTPIWSAVTDAQARDDYHWLKRTLRKLNILSGLMAVVIVFSLLISPFVYDLWVGDSVSIPFALSAAIAAYLIQQVIVAPFSAFINGFGKLKLGLWIMTGKLVCFIPIAIFLGKQYGVIGIVLSMLVIQIPSLIIEPLQTFKLVNKKANGIWGK